MRQADRVADVQGEGGRLIGKALMIAVTTKVEKNDLETDPIMVKSR